MDVLDRLALWIIYIAKRHYERIFLFSGVIVSLTALLHVLWVATHEPVLSNDAPIPAIVSNEPRPDSTAPGTGPIADSGQLADTSNQVFKILLPERFRGCWEGVAVLDSQLQLSSQRPAARWSPKRYRLCFVKQDLDTWQLHYGEKRIDSKGGRGIEREQTVEFVQVENATAMLRASVVPGSRRDEQYTMHEETTLDCELADAPGAVMRVRGDVVADVNGKPWRAARWHAAFARVRAPTSARRQMSQSSE